VGETVSPEEIDGLIERAKHGDRDAFRQVVLALQHDVFMFLCAFSVTESLVDEVLQATFVTAYQKLALYQPQGAFRAWLKRIARNLLLKELEERKRVAHAEGDRLHEIVVDAGLEDMERMDELEGNIRRLRGCLDRLEPDARRLIEARYLEQKSTALLAEHAKRTELWVRVTLCRIRKLLRHCMETVQASA
jgi:RNA polymerase sigma-70 factor (ECF subfamily)